MFPISLLSAQTMESVAPAASSSVKAISDLQYCATLPERGERLICYDRIAVELGVINEKKQQAQAAEMAQFGFWTVSTRINDMQEKITALKVDSAQESTTRMGYKRTPTFAVECKNRNTEVFMDWKSPLVKTPSQTKKIIITYKMDNLTKVTEEWDLSLDFASAFAPNPVEFVRNIKGRERLVIELTPYSEATQAMSFDIKNFEPALDVLIKECYH
ncbi:MAG: hypothetical protein HY370_10395 [Proteobacteria bacterium]|nr:hypothetical protein [Pseudomonadota bacterium]